MSNEKGYLRVRNWERFQHYKDRKPPWIKLHVELLDNYELTCLPLPAQLIYDRLLLLAAKTDNNTPNDHVWISGQTHVDQETVRLAVETLLDEGFLTLAESKRAASKAIARRKQGSSKTLPSRASAQSRETEAEVEKEKEQHLRAVPEARPETPANHPTVSEQPPDDEHEENPDYDFTTYVHEEITDPQAQALANLAEPRSIA